MFSCGGNCERMFRWWGWSGGLLSNTTLTPGKDPCHDSQKNIGSDTQMKLYRPEPQKIWWGVPCTEKRQEDRHFSEEICLD